MTICYSFPSRQRPDSFYKCLDNIRAMSESDKYFIVAKLDSDDPLAEKYKERLHEYPEVIVRWGFSKNKVDSINRSMDNIPPYDIVIIMADDIEWDVKGYDNTIRLAFQLFFPDLSGTVHFPDDHGKDKTIIVSILGVNLYKRLGYLYHPDYANLFCDNEFTEVTKRLKKYAFVDKRLFTHYHPIWQTRQWDDLYRANENPQNYRTDGAIFQRRKAKNFDL